MADDKFSLGDILWEYADYTPPAATPAKPAAPLPPETPQQPTVPPVSPGITSPQPVAPVGSPKPAPKAPGGAAAPRPEMCIRDRYYRLNLFVPYPLRCSKQYQDSSLLKYSHQN